MNPGPNALFPSRDGYDTYSPYFFYVHSLEGGLLYVSPEIEGIVGKASSFYLTKPYFSLIEEDAESCIRCKSNTEKTLELFKTDPNAVNSYEILLRNHKSDKPILCRLFERVLPNKDLQEIGVQGIVVVAHNNLDLLTNYYCFLLQKSAISFVCSPIKHAVLAENLVEDTIEKITENFETHLQFLNQTGDKWLDEGRKLFKEKTRLFVERLLPVEFILPAFPFKSPNREKKVLGHVPDKGERLALQTIHIFACEIQKVYPPGARVNIVSDGRVFADIFKVPDDHVTEFGSELRAIASEKGYASFGFYDLQYFLDKCETHDIARERLVTFFGRRVDDITKRVKEDPDYTRMYCGFTRFMLEDIYNFMENEKSSLRKKFQMSREGMKRDAKERAKFIMMRNDAYSRMVGTLFPLHLRLSIHAHNNSGPKFAIRLLPMIKISEKLIADKNMHIPTPWHNVVVEDKNGKYMLMKRFQAERHPEKAEIVLDKTGKPSHYVLKAE